MKKIKIYRSVMVEAGFSLVDDADYQRIKKHRWYYANRIIDNKYIYVKTFVGKKQILMHRMIMGANNPKIMVDHKNGNTLDNRKENLRICSASQNCQNSFSSNKNGKGVSKSNEKKRKKKWKSRIVFDKKEIYLGRFKTKKEAAIAYDRAAKKYFGKFAKLNFPEEK